MYDESMLQTRDSKILARNKKDWFKPRSYSVGWAGSSWIRYGNWGRKSCIWYLWLSSHKIWTNSHTFYSWTCPWSHLPSFALLIASIGISGERPDGKWYRERPSKFCRNLSLSCPQLGLVNVMWRYISHSFVSMIATRASVSRDMTKLSAVPTMLLFNFLASYY